MLRKAGRSRSEKENEFASTGRGRSVAGRATEGAAGSGAAQIEADSARLSGSVVNGSGRIAAKTSGKGPAGIGKFSKKQEFGAHDKRGTGTTASGARRSKGTGTCAGSASATESYAESGEAATPMTAAVQIAGIATMTVTEPAGCEGIARSR